MHRRTPFLQKFYIACTRYLDNELSNHAGAVAYYFLLSIIPIILLILAIFNTVLSAYPEFSDEFFYVLSEFSPQINSEFLERFGLSSAAARAIGIIGILNLLWTSRLILTSVQRAFDIIFPATKKRNFFVSSVISIIIIPVVFLLVTLFTDMRIITQYISEFLLELGVTEGMINSLGELSVIIPLGVSFAGAYICFRYLPQVRPCAQAAFRGAALFVVLLMVTKFVFGFVVNMARFNMLYGFIGAVIVLLLWVYMLCQIFFICAEFTYVVDNTEMLVINRVFSVHNRIRFNFIEKWLFGDKSGILRRYSDFFPQDTLFFSQGDNSKEVYYIYSGKVSILINGSQTPVATLKAGDIFGEMAHLLDSPRTSTAIAAEDSVIIRIAPATFTDILAINNKLSIRIINSLCERLKLMNDRLCV